MRYDKTFYLCTGELLYIKYTSKTGLKMTNHEIKMVRIDICKHPEMKGQQQIHADLVADEIQKHWPDVDYCLVTGLWDNGDWAVFGAVGCKDVERVE